METLYYERYIRTKRHPVPSSVLWALNTLQTRSYADSRIATVQIRGFMEIRFCRTTVEPNAQLWQHFTGKKQKQKLEERVEGQRGMRFPSTLIFTACPVFVSRLISAKRRICLSTRDMPFFIGP